MNLPQTMPMLVGQALLAVLILINTIVTYLSSQKRRRQEREDRERERQQEREDRKEIAKNLLSAQNQAAEYLKILTDKRSAELMEKVEAVHEELAANTKVNEEALTAANNFHVRLSELTREDGTLDANVSVSNKSKKE